MVEKKEKLLYSYISKIINIIVFKSLLLAIFSGLKKYKNIWYNYKNTFIEEEA